MPIQFRCGACRRLLRIARRKAGTVVKCPGCGTELIVPTEVTARLPAAAAADRPRPGRRPDSAPPPPPPHRANGHRGAKVPDSLPLFERPDFESLLNPAVKQATVPPPEPPPRPVPVPARPTPAPVPAARLPAPAEPYDVEPVGLVISKQNLTLMAVVVVVLIALAFAAGYLLAAIRLPAA